MADVDRAICVELATITANLVFFVLCFQDLIVWEDHSIDAVTDVRSFSELSKPLWPFLINNLLELEIISIEV